MKKRYPQHSSASQIKSAPRSRIRAIPQRASKKLISKMADYLVKNKITPVFDLDAVLIDASHRIKLHEDGSLDLNHYRANTTAENVNKDTTLPLLGLVHALNKLGKRYHVATARVACKHTQQYLRNKSINPRRIFARNGENDRRKDHELKKQALQQSFSEEALQQMLLIDDLKDNCIAAESLGMEAWHVET